MNSRRSKKWVIAALLLAIMLSAVAAYVNKPLPAYIDQPVEETSEQADLLWELAVYKNESISFPYPSDWKKVIKDGNLTFFNLDGSYLMFQKTEYRPQINEATEISIQNEIVASGMTPLSFEKLSTSSFQFSYAADKIITWEYVVWDREYECRMILSYPLGDKEEQYQMLSGEIIKSFQWEQSAPIPKELYLIYNTFGNYEFAVPFNWTTQVSNDTFFAINENTGSVFQATVSQTELISLQEISEIQYGQFASQNRSNLYIRSYGASATKITAESIYSNQDDQMLFYHLMTLEDGYLYEFILDTPLSKGEEDYRLFTECIKLFRTFKEGK